MADKTLRVEPLTDCESIVMKCLWDAGKDVSLMDIMETLEKKYQKEWKRQTVSTFLLHLIKKNFITSYRVGRVFYYRIEISLDDYMCQITNEFLDFWYEGSIEMLNQKVTVWNSEQ